MTQIVLCVRQPGGAEIQDSMLLEVPQVPGVGDYVSVSSLDLREPLSEDYIVRRVWWRLRRADETNDESVGIFSEVFVECDVSVGPYATASWQRMVAALRKSGIQIEPFDVARITVGLGNDISGDEEGQ